MNEYEELERQIRRLRPAPLPPDLAIRLKEPPCPESKHPPRPILRFALAAGLVALACATSLLIRSLSVNTEDPPVAESRPVSHLQKNSTFLGSRRLSLEEREGRMWEISEQEWLDETIVLCSSSHAEFRTSVIRSEIVRAPVQFQ